MSAMAELPSGAQSAGPWMQYHTQLTNTIPVDFPAGEVATSLNPGQCFDKSMEVTTAI
jgi:hypothetical protein